LFTFFVNNGDFSFGWNYDLLIEHRVIINWLFIERFFGWNWQEVWSKTGLNVTIVILKSKVLEFEETKDLMWNNKALVSNELIEWFSSFIKSLFEKTFKKSHVDISESGSDDLDILKTGTLNAWSNSHAINDGSEFKVKRLKGNIEGCFFGSIGHLNPEFDSNVSVESHSSVVFSDSQVLESSDII